MNIYPQSFLQGKLNWIWANGSWEEKERILESGGSAFEIDPRSHFVEFRLIKQLCIPPQIRLIVSPLKIWTWCNIISDFIFVRFVNSKANIVLQNATTKNNTIRLSIEEKCFNNLRFKLWNYVTLFWCYEGTVNFLSHGQKLNPNTWKLKIVSHISVTFWFFFFSLKIIIFLDSAFSQASRALRHSLWHCWLPVYVVCSLSDNCICICFSFICICILVVFVLLVASLCCLFLPNICICILVVFVLLVAPLQYFCFCICICIVGCQSMLFVPSPIWDVTPPNPTLAPSL